MEYVRYDPRRHRKPKAMKAGWRAMRIYEALIDISAVYDLKGSITPDYACSDFIAAEMNIKPDDWGFDPITGDMELELAVSECLNKLAEVGMLERSGDGGWRIKGWDEFYGSRRGGSVSRVSKFKQLESGTVVATQENFSGATPHHTTPPTPHHFSGDGLARLWNQWAAVHKLPQVTKVGGKRKTLADARAKEQPESYWSEVLAKIANSPGLMGKNDRGWSASFDWLVEPMSGAKVMEGKYDKWGKSTGSAQVMSAKDADELYGPGAE